MRVEVVVKCMQANFGECGFLDFGDFVPFAALQKW